MKYDDSDCCRRCGDLLTAPEVRRYREECNGADDGGTPTYCQECLDQLHLLEGTPLDVPDEMWSKGQWWRPAPGTDGPERTLPA
jgi:hypothetical protein